MKKVWSLLLSVLVLTGCAAAPKEMDRALALRTKLLQSSACSFDAQVTADYGDKLYTFGIQCTADDKGDLTFRVTAPESISGITGKITREGGVLTFDETALHFELLADDQLSPVSAPWVLLKALRGGYITSAGMDGELLCVSVNDSYEDDALNLDVWLNGDNVPEKADICYDGKRILSMRVENAVIS